MVTLSGCKTLKSGLLWFKPRWGQFLDQFSDLDLDKDKFLEVLGGGGGGNLIPPLQFAALFSSCARENCALSEYPRRVNWYNDIFEIRALSCRQFLGT